MIGIKPVNRDQLGAEHKYGENFYAVDATASPIPNDETIILLNWLRILKPYSVSASEYHGFYLLRTSGGVHGISIRGEASGLLNCGSYAGSWQNLVTPPTDGDAMYAIVVDRDNTQLELWVDGMKADSAALTQDPNLSSNNRSLLFHNAAAYYSQTCWRGLAMSIANGQTPTQEELEYIFRSMRNPNTPVPDLLSAVKGSFFSDYRPGEGDSDSAIVVDQGDNGDDMAWQGGTKVRDVRVRRRAAWVQPRYDYYELKPGYRGQCVNQNFGITVNPLVVRAVLGSSLFRAPPASTNYPFYLRNDAGNYRITLECQSVSPYNRIGIRSNGVWTYYDLVGDQEDGGDLWLIFEGTSLKILLNGQQIDSDTIGAAMDLSGVCDFFQCVYANLLASDYPAPCSRFAVWNPTSLPADLIDEIQRCVAAPDMDPASLGDPAIDFPLHSGILANPTDTDVANQGTGGGTFVLDAGRDTSCSKRFAGTNP